MPAVPYPVHLRVEGNHLAYRNNWIPILKFGRNDDLDSGDGEVLVWDVGTTYSYQSAAQTLEVLSSSVNDTAAGSGARTLRLMGVDADWNLQDEYVTLDGVTPVSTVNQYLRVYRSYVLTAGAGGINEGDVTWRVESGGDIQARLPAGDGTTFLSLMPIPRGYEGYLYDVRVTTDAAPNSEITTRLRLRPDGGVFRTIFEEVANRDSPVVRAPTMPARLPEMSDFAVTASAVANNTTVFADFDVVLVPV